MSTDFAIGFRDGNTNKENRNLSEEYVNGYRGGLLMKNRMNRFPICLFIRSVINPEVNMYKICNIQSTTTVEDIKMKMIHESQDSNVYLSRWFLRRGERMVPIRLNENVQYHHLENNGVLFFETVEQAVPIFPIEFNFPLSEHQKQLYAQSLIGPNIPSASSPWTLRDGRDADHIFPSNPLMPHISLRRRLVY